MRRWVSSSCLEDESFILAASRVQDQDGGMEGWGLGGREAGEDMMASSSADSTSGVWGCGSSLVTDSWRGCYGCYEEEEKEKQIEFNPILITYFFVIGRF